MYLLQNVGHRVPAVVMWPCLTGWCFAYGYPLCTFSPWTELSYKKLLYLCLYMLYMYIGHALLEIVKISSYNLVILF